MRRQVRNKNHAFAHFLVHATQLFFELGIKDQLVQSVLTLAMRERPKEMPVLANDVVVLFGGERHHAGSICRSAAALNSSVTSRSLPISMMLERLTRSPVMRLPHSPRARSRMVSSRPMSLRLRSAT